MNSPLVLCPRELRPALRLMLDELEWFGLQVGLVPAPEQRHAGHFVRLVLGHNPGWYRELAAAFPRTRRMRRQRHQRFSDPRFKRADVAAVLRRLIEGGTRSYLAWPLLAVAAELHQRAQEAQAETDRELAAAWFPWDVPAGAAALEVAL